MSNMEPSELMFENLTLAGKSAVELISPKAATADQDVSEPGSRDDIYYLQVQQYAGDADEPVADGKMAVLCSSQCIRIYDPERIVRTCTIDKSDAQVTKVRFGNTSPHLLYSSSVDSKVRCWDLRTELLKPVNEYITDGIRASPAFLSFDLTYNDKYFCAGTKKQHDEALLYFWDQRMSKCMECYKDMHSDDITQVRYHSHRQDSLVTAADDGLVNYMDISEGGEDDALQYTLDTESTPDEIGWLNDDDVYVTTFCNKAYIWSTETGDESLKLQLSDFQRPPGGDSVKDVDYLVDCFLSEDKSPTILAGNNKCEGLVYTLDDKTAHLSTLSKGHTEWIRACSYNRKTQYMYTVGEDALLCCWKPDNKISDPAMKCKSSKTPTRHKHKNKDKPYSRK